MHIWRFCSSAALCGTASVFCYGCLTTPASETGWSGRARHEAPGVCGNVADALIEDAEDGDTRGLVRAGRGGYWFSFLDSSGSTLEPAQGSFKMAAPGNAGSQHAAHMHGHAAAVGDSVYAGIGLSLAEPRGPYDASRYDGITFWAKGPAHVRLEIPDGYTAPEGKRCKDCYNDFGIELALAAGWQRYTVKFEWLAQRQGWGDPRPEIAREELYAIEWQFGSPGRDFDVWIDDVSFSCAGAP
jgi:endoglucanase